MNTTGSVDATIVAIANQKGGVGKSTTAINLGAALALQGERILLVDLDPQGNTSSGLGLDRRSINLSTYDLLVEEADIEDVVEPTSVRDLFLIPATIELAGAEIEMVSMFSRERRLASSLKQVLDQYDFVLIDCPPSLGLLTINGLAAANEVMIPIQCEYYALEGVSQLVANIQRVRANVNPSLDVEGVVLTMYDGRTNLAADVVSQVRTHFGDTTYRPSSPGRCVLSEAPSFGEPIEAFDPMSRGAIAYRELAREFRRAPWPRVRVGWAGAWMRCCRRIVADEGFFTVPLDRVGPNPEQPRRNFDESELEALAASIREVGILQPIVVRPEGDDGRYALVAGERRCRAARLAGLRDIPAVVRARDGEGGDLTEALIENVQRQDLGPLEEAAAYRQLMEDFGWTHDTGGTAREVRAAR